MILAATSTDVNEDGFWKLVLSFRFGEQNRDATNAKDPRFSVFKIRFRFGLLQCHIELVV